MTAQSKANAPANIKSVIQNASTNLQSTVAKTETAAVSMVDRVDDALNSIKSNFNGVKTFGTDVMDVVDNAGRTVVGGVVTLQSSVVNYGKDVVNDTIEVGRKTLEVKSLPDAVQLHSAFAERRINALFQTVSAINAINHTNVMAMWSPLATMINTMTGQIADKAIDIAKAPQSTLKSAA
jgi:hypothetical protein